MVVDPGAATAVFSGGMLDLSANSGQASNNITEDAYVNLPNGTISSASSAGVSGAVAFEFWYTLSESRTWQRIADFGNSNDGEDTSNLGSAMDYLSVVATSGRGNIVDMTNHTASGNEPAVGLGGTATLGVPTHVMAVYNHNDFRAFTPAGANGTMTLYVDGALVGYGPIHPDIDINTFDDVNNWLGRSQWPDPLFDGLYDEVRIYDTAPSPDYVAASFAAGPDSLATFTPWVEEFNLSMTIDRDTGEFTLTNAGPSIDVVGIRIASAAESLDPAAWLSVANNYDSDSGSSSFDPDNAWAINPSTPALLDEVELAGDGGQLGTGGTQTSLQLGDVGAWTLSTYEDVVVSVDRLLPDFSIETIGVRVEYVGGLGEQAARSDLNFDGQVNAADWVLFASNHFADLSGMTIAQAATHGDLDRNLTNDFDDYLLFEADFDAANGPGALVALISAVPEPSTAVLAFAGVALACGIRRRGVFSSTANARRVVNS